MPLAFKPLHVHVFDLHNPTAERRTRQVMWLTAAMMVVVKAELAQSYMAQARNSLRCRPRVLSRSAS